MPIEVSAHPLQRVDRVKTYGARAEAVGLTREPRRSEALRPLILERPGRLPHRSIHIARVRPELDRAVSVADARPVGAGHAHRDVIALGEREGRANQRTDHKRPETRIRILRHDSPHCRLAGGCVYVSPKHSEDFIHSYTKKTLGFLEGVLELKNGRTSRPQNNCYILIPKQRPLFGKALFGFYSRLGNAQIHKRMTQKRTTHAHPVTGCIRLR